MDNEIDSMKTILNYIDTEYSSAKKREREVNILREKFIDDFPLEKIEDMVLDDYLIGAKEYVKEHSFCYRLKYELKELASMGNLRNDIFGIYKVKNELKLSEKKGIKQSFSNDYFSAFEFIKKEIVSVLKATKNREYSIIEKSSLQMPFYLRLMMVYYPDSTFCACTKSALDDYCSIIGLKLPMSTSALQMSNALLDWRDNHLDKEMWSNYLFMALLDWLRRKNLSINGDEIKLVDYSSKARQIEKEIEELNIDGKTKEKLVKVRVNQGIFRDRLLTRYNKCCLCNVNNPQLLVASHIKPWSECEDSEKLLVDNGFLLCPNHDSLFDKGLISFNDDGTIIISSQLDEVNRMFMNVKEGMKIKVVVGNIPFLRYHREHIFEK